MQEGNEQKETEETENAMLTATFVCFVYFVVLVLGGTAGEAAYVGEPNGETCPSCHQKRTLLTAIHVTEDVCAPVAHRQVVLTIPKRLRVHTRFDRKLLGKLCAAVWTCIQAEVRRLLGRDDVVPGMIAAIQTHGELLSNPLIVPSASRPADGTFAQRRNTPCGLSRPACSPLTFHLLPSMLNLCGNNEISYPFFFPAVAHWEWNHGTYFCDRRRASVRRAG